MRAPSHHNVIMNIIFMNQQILWLSVESGMREGVVAWRMTEFRYDGLKPWIAVMLLGLAVVQEARNIAK